MTVKALISVRTVNLRTPILIAAHAHPTRARCQFGYKHLTPANSFGYTPAVSAKKALIGIGVPSHPYDESRRTSAVSAASLSVPLVLVARMGGRKAAGSCKGCPVRQPCPSYLLGLASGEVVFANHTPWRPLMAQSFASAHDDLVISIHPRAYTRYHGTAAQLIAEGLIPEGFTWPQKAGRVSFEMGGFSYWTGRCRPDGIKGPMSIWVDGDYWFLQRSLTADEGTGWHRARIYEKTMELAGLLRCNTIEWNRLCNSAWETRKDTAYQLFRQRILGEPKRGRGRPTKHSSTTLTKKGEAA